MNQSTKRVIDLFALILLGIWPALFFWADYADYHNDHVSRIWIVFMLVHILLASASIFWFAFRWAKTRDANWLVAYPRRRTLFLLLVMLCSVAIGISINWLRFHYFHPMWR